MSLSEIRDFEGGKKITLHGIYDKGEAVALLAGKGNILKHEEPICYNIDKVDKLTTLIFKRDKGGEVDN